VNGVAPGRGTAIATSLGTVGTAGSAGWAALGGGPVWVPIVLAATTVVLGIVQALLNTVRDIVPQESGDRLAATRMLLTFLTARRRDRIKERRERADRRAIAPARRSRTTVAAASAGRSLLDDRQAPGRAAAG